MFDPDRWNGHMGLDNPNIIQDVKKTGARCGRWNKGDMVDGAFEKVIGAVLMCIILVGHGMIIIVVANSHSSNGIVTFSRLLIPYTSH